MYHFQKYEMPLDTSIKYKFEAIRLGTTLYNTICPDGSMPWQVLRGIQELYAVHPVEQRGC